MDDYLNKKYNYINSFVNGKKIRVLDGMISDFVYPMNDLCWEAKEGDSLCLTDNWHYYEYTDCINGSIWPFKKG